MHTQARSGARHRIVILGAGAVGCFLGGALASAGASIALLGRARVQADVRKEGLTLTDLHGETRFVSADRVEFVTEPDVLASADLVLVTVKSHDTAHAADQLRQHAPPACLVVSFQNGVRNTGTLQAAMPAAKVLPGMVAFNVVNQKPGHWHRATEGELQIARDASISPYLDLFRAAGIPLLPRDDMIGVLWGKLIFNLNNPINALAGVPLRQQLLDRAYRRCAAACIAEGLVVLRASGIEAAEPGRIPLQLLPWILRLPDALFTRVADRMLRIDPAARSSMCHDLDSGRPTEVDYLNGEIVRLAREYREPAPVNARITGLIHAAEAGGRRDWSSCDLLALLRPPQSA